MSVLRGVLVTALLLHAGACGKDPAALRIANGPDPSSLDPHLASSVSEGRILSSLWAGLTKSNPTNLEVMPGLAETWTPSENGRIWTFKIRDNLRWSDGSPLTTKDVKASWVRLQNPKTGAPYQNWVADASISTSSNSVRIEFPNPQPQFPAMCSWPALAPIPPGLRNENEIPGEVSSGPYTLKYWKIRDRVRVIRNPFYWKKNSEAPESIDFLTVESSFTALNLFLSGEVDWTPLVPRLAALALVKKKEPSFSASPRLGTTFLRFQAPPSSIHDYSTIKTLSDAIDRKKLAEVVGPGSIPAISLTPPGLPGYAPPLPSRFSHPVKPKLHGRLELIFPSSDANRIVAEFLQDQWKRNLGVEVLLVNQEWKAFLRTQQSGNYQISLSSWIADYPDPLSFLEIFHSDSGNNRTGWENVQYDTLLDMASQEGNPSERLKILRRAESLLIRGGPIVPLTHEAGTDLISSQWSNIRPGPMGNINWERIRPRSGAK
ncbi:MAG TPA: hypothetical protein DDW23_07880 [Planctomycetes bacterium]|nr:hypothetical protein [Planctomycetota bacterium]